MATLETKFSVGDKVWFAGTTTTGRQHPCPDCLETKRWTAKSPAGDEFTFGCPRCCAGYSSHDSASLKYTAHVAYVRPLTIGSIRYDTQPFSGDGPVSYMCVETGVGGGSVYQEDRLFDCESAALAHAETLANLANSSVKWVVERYKKTLEVSDYQLSNAILKQAEEQQAHARSLLCNINDLFCAIEEAGDREEILEVIEEYKRYSLEGDRAAASKVSA